MFNVQSENVETVRIFLDNFNVQSDFYTEYTEIISLIIGVAWMTMHTGSDVSKIVTRGLCPGLYLPHEGIYAEQLRSKYK